MKTMALRGRPSEYNEAMIRRQFELPESLNEKLEKARRPVPGSIKKIAAVDIVREALEAWLDKGETQDSSTTKESHSLKYSAVISENSVAAIERALRNLLKPEILKDEGGSDDHEIVEEKPRPALSPLPEKYQKLIPSHLPVFKLSGKVTAGSWREAIEDPQFLTARDLLDWKSDDEDFLLEINPDDGESLEGDGIAPGDYVHVRSTSDAENGDIVLVVGEDENGMQFATLKHWHRRGNRVELRPSNPKCKAIVASVKDVEIHGVVLNSIKRGFRKSRRK